MKNNLFLCLLIFSSLTARAQVAQNQAATKTVKLELEKMEVRDSAGIIYAPEVVRGMLQSGEYKLKVSWDKTIGTLVRLSPEEINKKMANMVKPSPSHFFSPGEKISSFNERDIDGNKHNLKELAGKVVVLNFWFINCPPCRMEIPQLNKLVDDYKDSSDVVFIAIGLDKKDEIREFLKMIPYKYAIIDEGRYIADKYGINSYPTHVVVDRQGKVIFHTSGLTSGTVPWLKKSINAGLNNTTLQ